MAEFLGRQVKLCLNNGKEYEGFVHSLDPNTGKLTLEKVVLCETGKKIPGLRSYFGNEINSVEVLEEGKSKKKDDDKIIPERPEKREAGPSIMHRKHTPAHLSRLRTFKPTSCTMKRSLSNEDNTEKGNSKNDKSSDYDSAGFSSEGDNADLDLGQPFILINKTNHKFDQAIMSIKKESVIGVALEGVGFGREGKLCWLQIGTRDSIFLFDVLTMQKSCFEHGLSEILEDEDILKVIHDCRLPSDLFYHQYNIQLCNVFDTQVADVFVYRLLKGSGKWPQYAKGLASCLMEHLNLSDEQIYSIKIRENYKKEDQEAWAERPPPKNCLNFAVNNVKYLRELRIVLMEKMLAEYVAGVDVYLAEVKSASEDDAKKYRFSQSHLVPHVFHELPTLMSNRYPRWHRGGRTSVMRTDDKGFVDNIHDIRESNVVFSSDSIWHTPHHRKDQSKPSIESKSKDVKTSISQPVENIKPTKQPAENMIPNKQPVESMKPDNQSNTLKTFTPLQLNLKAGDKSSENKEKESVGSLMRRLINQSSDSEGQSSDDFVFKPAGEMLPQGIDKKKRRKQLEQYDSITANSQSEIQHREDNGNINAHNNGYNDKLDDVQRDNLIYFTSEMNNENLHQKSNSPVLMMPSLDSGTDNSVSKVTPQREPRIGRLSKLLAVCDKSSNKSPIDNSVSSDRRVPKTSSPYSSTSPDERVSSTLSPPRTNLSSGPLSPQRNNHRQMDNSSSSVPTASENSQRGMDSSLSSAMMASQTNIHRGMDDSHSFVAITSQTNGHRGMDNSPNFAPLTSQRNGHRGMDDSPNSALLTSQRNGHRGVDDKDLHLALKNTTNRMDQLTLLREALNKRASNS